MLRVTGIFLAILLAAHVNVGLVFGQNGLVLEEASGEQILAEVRSSSASVTVLNFWATWCIPCRDEMPRYIRLARELGASAVRVIFVSTDFPEDAPEVRQFLMRYGVTGVAYRLNGSEAALSSALGGKYSGALPATALFGSDGTVIEFWEGTRSYSSLKARISGLL